MSSEPVINRHLRDFRGNYDFTVEYDVKHICVDLGEELNMYETETGTFVNKYGDKCFKEILSCNDVDVYVKDWSFAGRMNGWFVLLCKGDITEDDNLPKEFVQINKIINKYITNYKSEIKKFYFDAMKKTHI